MIDYSKVLSKKAVALKPSGIRKFFDILDEMDDVVSLTVGQPDFVTPWHIRDAAIDSLEKARPIIPPIPDLCSSVKPLPRISNAASV